LNLETGKTAYTFEGVAVNCNNDVYIDVDDAFICASTSTTTTIP